MLVVFCSLHIETKEMEHRSGWLLIKRSIISALIPSNAGDAYY